MRLHFAIGDLKDALTFSSIAKKTALYEHSDWGCILADDMKAFMLHSAVNRMSCSNERSLDEAGEIPTRLIVVESLDAVGTSAGGPIVVEADEERVLEVLWVACPFGKSHRCIPIPCDGGIDAEVVEMALHGHRPTQIEVFLDGAFMHGPGFATAMPGV